eukprot:Seg2416.2 transcript_id=Seg2416.2/GoldUCD/mRNA.D3Y31 product="Toxin CrTX-A" protein_id=Seg2416.2/GoldUCD/D3Y31
MKLLLKGAYLLFLVSFVLSDDVPTDEEVDEAFRELDRQLNDRAELKQMIQEVKDEVKKGPDYAKNALGMAKALSTAVPKLKSDNPLTIAEGALSLISGIAENFPGGMVVATIASLVSSVIGIFTPRKASNAIKDTMEEVIKESSDQDLADSIEAFRSKLTLIMGYIQEKKKQEIDRNDVEYLIDQIPSHIGGEQFSLLGSRIHRRAKASSASEGERGYQFCVMYAQLAAYRTLVIKDLAILFRKAEDADEASAYENVDSQLGFEHGQRLKFLNAPKPEQAGTVVHYYPPGHSAGSKYLKNFLKKYGGGDPPVWLPTSYMMISVEWPSWHLYFKAHDTGGPNSGSSTYYLAFQQSYTKSNEKMHFGLRGDGYWTLKIGSRYASVEKPSAPHWLVGNSRFDTNNQNGHFVVIQYPGTDILTVSCRKWPSTFLSGEGGKFSVILKQGNSGKPVQWYADECKKTSKSESTPWGGYYCGDYTPKPTRRSFE